MRTAGEGFPLPQSVDLNKALVLVDLGSSGKPICIQSEAFLRQSTLNGNYKQNIQEN